MKMHTVKIITSIVLIFAVIMGAGFFTTAILSKTSDELEVSIHRIENNVKNGKWPDAKNELDSIEKDWSTIEKKWSMLIDHIEIDNIETSLSRMSQYIESKDATLALAETAALMNFVKHIPEKESFNIKNIL